MVVGGAPLIAHALAHARASGCLEAVIVVGHQGARVRSAVDAMAPGLTVRFITIPDAAEPNGTSLLAAAPVAASRFFLQMVDHVFSSTVLPKLVHSPLRPHECGRVLVDCMPGASLDIEDATKVRLVGDRVVAIGKNLQPWDAIDAGCFVLTPAVFDAVREVSDPARRTVSSAMRKLAAHGALGAVDVWEVEWADVDTPDDHEVAERLLLAAQPHAAVAD
jgi:choline kinase